MNPSTKSVVFGVLCTASLTSFAATLRVDGDTYRDARSAYAVAKDGDVIEIPAGQFVECAGGFHPPKRISFVPIGGTATITGTTCDLPNDSFSNPAFLFGTNVRTNGGNYGATSDGCEDRILGSGSGQSVWWSWTAPADGLAQVTSLFFGTGQGRLAGVFVGNSVCDLTTITAAEVDPPPFEPDTPLNPLFFDATSNTTYHIAFDTTFGTRSIGFQLTLVPHPANDDYSTPFGLRGYWANAEGSTLAATRGSNDPNPFGAASAGKTVWWKWTAPPSARPGRPAIISTAGSKFDTLLAVFQQTSGGLALVASNDDHETEQCTNPDPANTLSSQVRFFPIAGTTYHIMVDGSVARKDLLGSDRKLLMQYSGDVRLALDFSTLNIADACHYPTNRCSFLEECNQLSGSLYLAHYGDRPTRALRVSLRAGNGYNMTSGFNPINETRLLTNLTILPAGLLTPEHPVSLTYSDVSYPSPDPDQPLSGGGDGRRGWGVFAVLEEEFGDGWIPVDAALIVYGRWPRVAPFGGPNGGVIRSDPSRPAPNLLTDILIKGPAVMCENETGMIIGQAIFDTGFSNAQPEWSWTGPLTLSSNGLATNAFVTVQPLSSHATATISASLAFAGSTIPATSNLTVHLLNDCFQFHATTRRSNGFTLEFVDRPGKRIAIDCATALTIPTLWLPLETNVIPATSSLIISNTVPTNVPQRFYRARELP